MNIFKKILSNSKNNNKILLKDEGYSYAQFYIDTQKYYNFFKENLKEGDVIAVVLNYSKSFLNIIFAAEKNKNVITFINPSAPKNEKKFIIKNSKCKIFITNKKKDLRVKFKKFDNLFFYFNNDKNKFLKKNDIFIVYTSGTTNKPKGAILTKNSVSSNIRAINFDLKLKKNDSSLIFSPPHYAMAYSQILTYMYKQLSFVFLNSGLKFPDLIIKNISKYNLNIINLSISGFKVLFYRTSQNRILKNIRIVMAGGIPMTYEMLLNYKKKFPNAEIVNFYGCTENSPRITHQHIKNPQKFKKTINHNVPVGKALKGVSIKIENKNNEFGKIFISGTSLMRGYLSKNKNLLTKIKKKWFETGDIGFFDRDKNLILMGRDDDTFRVGHEKLCPEEIEPIIKKKFKLQEAVIGKSKNNILNWEPVLVLNKREFLKKKHLISELKKHLNDYLDNYKIPKKIMFLKELPKTLYGKINRNKINDFIEKKK